MRHNIVVSCCVLLCALVACYTFLRGFLMTKSKSNASIHMNMDKFNSSILNTDAKLIIFLIDGLQLDMLRYYSEFSDPENPLKEHLNLFTNIHELLWMNSSQTLLFGFRADPPTTTSQRLKSIISGTFPNYIDMTGNIRSSNSSNFGTTTTDAPNMRDRESDIISNLKLERGKKIIFMGDDTWLTLVPREIFSRCHAFESYNTKDLHSVDDSIQSVMWNELSLSAAAGWGEWDVAILHFLGVDHIGHTHNSHAPQMMRKLKQLDALAGEVIATMRGYKEEGGPDVLFLLFGDHGMTSDGEHGGATEEELNSGLFVYSTQHLFQSKAEAEGKIKTMWDPSRREFRQTSLEHSLANPRILPQIDLAPTLAQLFNISTPGDSMGVIIPEFFTNPGGCIGDAQICRKRELLDNLYVNVQQVWDSLGHSLGFNLSASMSSDAANLSHFDADEEVIRFNNRRVLYVEEYLRMSMLSDAEVIERDMDECIARFASLLCDIQQFSRVKWTTYNLPGMLLSIAIMCTGFAMMYGDSCIFVWGKWNWSERGVTFYFNSFSGCCWCVVLLHSLSLFSNSFIQEEAQIVYYSTQTMIWLHWMWYFAVFNMSSKTPAHTDNRKTEPRKLLVTLLCVGSSVVVSILVRLATLEEESVVSFYMGYVFLFFSVLYCTCVYGADCDYSPISATKWDATIVLRAVRSGFMNMGVVYLCVVLVAYCMRRSSSFALVDRILELLAMLLVQLLLLWLEQCWISRDPVRGGEAEKLISQRYFTMSLSRILYVYLLVPLFLCMQILTPHSDSVTQYMLLFAVCGAMKIVGNCIAQMSPSAKCVDMVDTVSGMFVYYVVSQCGFFTSRHEYSFSSLQLSVGFTFGDEFNYYEAGTLLFFNTIMYDVLCVCILCLLTLSVRAWKWPPSDTHLTVSVALINSGIRVRYMQALAAMVCVWLHRHHLMLWAVFTPKWIFNTAFFAVDVVLITLLACVLGG